MIISLLLDLLYGVFAMLTLPISIPGMPAEIKEFIAIALDYITSGVGIASQFFDLNYLFMLFSIIIIVDGSIFIYKLTMWIIKKIPMLDVE